MTYLLIPLKQHNPPPLITRCEVVSGMVELDGRDNVGWNGQQTGTPEDLGAPSSFCSKTQQRDVCVPDTYPL